MESKTNYTIVGIIVLILTAGLLSTALWLSVGFNQKVYHTYTVYLHEAASGLSEESPVKFNGVQVGYVKAIHLNKNDPRQVEILLDIQEGTPITTSTAATLISQGITGVTYVGLSAGSSELTPLKKMPGEPYPVIPARPSLFNQLDSILKEVAENVNKVSNQAQLVFNEENAAYLQNSLKNTDILMANMAKVSKDFPKIVAQFNTLATDLGQAGQNVSQTMISSNKAVNKITQQTIPPAVTLLQRLNTIAANLEKLSNEMRQNPSVIIRGTKAAKPGPGE